MNSFSTSFLVDQSPTKVFNAVSNVRGWWSNLIDGETDKLNAEFTFEVKGVHYSKMKITEFVPGKRVVWLVLESNLSFVKDHQEWDGTQIIFDISQKGDQTELVFTHEGLFPEVECYEACSPAWTAYMQHSLFKLITTGKGDPNLEGREIESIKPQ